MSDTNLKILTRLTAFWPANHDADADVGAPLLVNPDTLTVVSDPSGDDTTTDAKGIITPPVEVEPRYYRYVKGSATSDEGETYDYTDRFISDPKADEAMQQKESEECQAVVQAELDRWLKAQAKPEIVTEPVVEMPSFPPVAPPSVPVVAVETSTGASDALNLLNNTKPQK